MQPLMEPLVLQARSLEISKLFLGRHLINSRVAGFQNFLRCLFNAQCIFHVYLVSVYALCFSLLNYEAMVRILKNL